MPVFFLLLVIALVVVPANLKNYDVIIIPLANASHKKAVEVYLLPRKNLPQKRHRSSRLDMEEFKEPTEMPDVDNFDIRSSPYRAEAPHLSLGRQADGNQEEDYNIDDNDNRIVGGAEVDINMYPYHVGYGTNCGGAIIGPKWVITAGHCGMKPYIRTGSKYLGQGKKTMVARNHIHPMWALKNKEHPFDYDFQVLELEEELNFDENTQPVKLGHIEDMVIGKVVTVTGWGNTEESGAYSSVLRAVNVPIISKEHCQAVPFPYFRGGLTPRMFCAGYSEGKKDACQGDSGGPAVAFDRLLGMVSFGYGCATPGSYGVYSKIAKVRDWVQTVTNLDLD